MKKILYIISMAVAMTFASCQKDNFGAGGSDGDGAVAFSAESISPLTKVSGDEWQKGDAIGITEITTSNSNVIYDNIKYIAAEDGSKVSFNPDSEIIYGSDYGVETYYMAYYPYQESWSYEANNMIFDLSGQDGTAEAQDKVDLLKSFVFDHTDGDPVVLQFTHALSKVEITVSNYDIISVFDDLSALSATLFTRTTQYNMIGEETASSDARKEFKMVETSNDGERVTFTVIIAPGEVNNEIIFTDGKQSYSATLAISIAQPGKQYNFTATVGDQGFSILELNSDGVTDWDSQTDSTIGSGIEIKDGVYQISTAEELTLFAKIVNSGNTSINGKLLNNIDLNGSESNQWTPIGFYVTSGEYKDAYSGTFDGGGFKVSGLYINGSSSYQGLFGCTYGATISNLGVGGSVTGNSNLGGVVGYAYANSDNSSSITNCYSSCSVSGVYENIGGVAGQSNASISGCHNSGYISGDEYCIGGIVGLSHNSVSDCYNTTDVSGKRGFVGGIAGHVTTSDAITNCYNEGSKVSSEGNYVGGIAGQALGFITDCYNMADVTSEGTHVAGIVGNATGSSAVIANCYNIGSCVYGAGEYVGGVVGQYVGSSYLANCYNWADVTGDSDFIGGVAGMSLKSTICYNAGAVTGTGTYVGGVIGQVYNSATYCYFDSDKFSGEGIGSGSGEVAGYSTDDMQSLRLINNLNNGTYTYNLASPTIEAYAWQLGEDDYPIFDTDNEAKYTQFDIAYDTKNSVYNIYTANGLRIFADLVNGTDQSVSEIIYDNNTTEIAQYFDFTAAYNETSGVLNGKLMNNIDLGGIDENGDGIEENQWTPIGNSNDKGIWYDGTFDGDYHEVSGLYINSTEDGKGLFGYVNGVYSTTVIKNIGVSGSIKGKGYLGGIAGYIQYANLSNCYNEASVSGSWSNVGGVAGYLNYSDMTDCYNAGDISITTAYTGLGGVVGSLSYSCNISNCYSAGLTKTSSSSTSNFGGVIGKNTNSSAAPSTISYCYYDSTVSQDVPGAVNSADDGTNYCGLSTEMMKGAADTEGTLLYYFTQGGSTAWRVDTEGINKGYPILIWQNSDND